MARTKQTAKKIQKRSGSASASKSPVMTSKRGGSRSKATSRKASEKVSSTMIKNPQLKKISKSVGVTRLSGGDPKKGGNSSYDEMRRIVSLRLKDIITNASIYTTSSKRKTIFKSDLEEAMRLGGYSTGFAVSNVTLVSKSYKPFIAKQLFRRLCRSMVSPDFNFSKDTFQHLQLATENYIASIYHDALKLAKHCHRVGINGSDINIVHSLRRYK